MAELIYYCGTMDSGKSTLALQTEHNHASRGRRGLIYTRQDRAGAGILSSRLGLESPAIEVTEDLDFHREVVQILSHGERVDFLICDEAQFYTPAQVEQLARIVDNLGIDVFAFGIRFTSSKKAVSVISVGHSRRAKNRYLSFSSFS